MPSSHFCVMAVVLLVFMFMVLACLLPANRLRQN